MSDIRYVCMSDLHLGAENSILTRLAPKTGDGKPSKADPMQANGVMTEMAACLKTLISKNSGAKKPTLVLNGDALELALADVNVASMVFERFMELTMKPGEELFDNTIYYNPGNHDHHLWETARETQYTDRYLAGTQWGTPLDPPWHTTKMFLDDYDPVPCNLLNKLVQRFPGTKPDFQVVYPNFGVRSADGKKCVIFSHGHYIESIYRLMTSLRSTLFPDRVEPVSIWDLEAENFAWVDFFWSTLGRSGAFGVDVELIYDKLQSSEQLKAMVSNLAAGFAKSHKLGWLPQSLEHAALTSLLDLMVTAIAHREVLHPGGVLTPDAESGLRQFIEKYLLQQILTENNNVVPAEVTFIFGHTHKPFEKSRTYAGYQGDITVINDGGWVVDSMTPAPVKGAAIVLVDDDLNTASIRLYNEAGKDSDLPPAPHLSEALDNPLTQRLKTIITTTAPWTGLTQAIFNEVPLQRANLGAKIQEQT
jgi:UDP-2,3-diacylglucosamine pyrophosphatase LpxH